jgi:acyl carrier protein
MKLVIAIELGIREEDITPTTKFHDLTRDSLELVGLIQTLEEEFGIEVDNPHGLFTVQDAIHLVEQH